MQDILHESVDRRASTDRFANGVEFRLHFFGLDGMLGESRTRRVSLARVHLPIGVQLVLRIGSRPGKKHLLACFRSAAKLHAFEEGLDHIFAAAGHGNGDAEVALDLLVLAEQHVEHDAVDLVVDAKVGQHADLVFGLSEAVDATFSLFVPCRIPRQVVVNHRVEQRLQVDAFAETVGADENPLSCSPSSAMRSSRSFGGSVPVTATTSTFCPVRHGAGSRRIRPCR